MRRLLKILMAIMFSCKEATFLISIAEEKKLSFGQRIRLRIHLLSCDACKNFKKQISYLSEGYKKFDQGLKEGKILFTLSKEDKLKLDKDLNE